MNIFSVESVGYEPVETNRGLMQVEAFVKAEINTFCNEHGNRRRRLRLQTAARHAILEEAMRKAVENLFNHNMVESDIDYYNPRCSCIVIDGHINFNFSALQEPWRGLFTHLFTGSNWTIPKELSR